MLWPVCVHAYLSLDLLHVQPPPASLAMYWDNAACMLSRDWHTKYGFEDTRSDCVIIPIPSCFNFQSQYIDIELHILKAWAELG